MKYFSQTILWGRYTVFVGVIFVGCVGCNTSPKDIDEIPSPEPAPIVETTIQHEDDVVVVLYDASDPSARMPTSNSRVRLSESGVAQTSPTEDGVAEQGGVRQGAATDPSKSNPPKGNLDGVSDSQNQPRRTSMPSRDQKNKKAPPVGGVRKALPIDHTASELFGKWRVDQEKSSVGFLRAEFVLFLSDGRMRIWRDGIVEDGRWSWNKVSGIKTGGLDGVPFSLGTFGVVEKNVVITSDDDKSIVLIPDRIFIVPPPVVLPPKDLGGIEPKAP